MLETFSTGATLAAALGTIASVLYLALQIRQASRATTASSMDSWLSNYNALVLELVRDRELAALFRRAIADLASLDGTAQLRFHGWMVTHLLNAQTLFMQVGQGTMNRDIGEQILGVNAALLKTPGGAAWWATARGIWRADFVAHLDRLIADTAPITEVWPFFADTTGEPRC